MYRVIVILTIIFALFIAWVIYMADFNRSCIFFDLVKIIPCGDTLGHLLLFGFLTLGVNIVLKLRGVNIGSITVPYGAILIIFVAVIEEISQFFIPVRTLDLTDLMADFAGIVSFSIISYSHFMRHLTDMSLK